MVPWMGKIFILAVLIGLAWAEEEEKMDVHFEGMDIIDGSENYFHYNYSLDKKSETAFSVSGFISQLVQLDNGYGLRMKLSRANLDAPEPAQYEEMLGVEKPVCEYMTSIYKMYFYDSLKDISNFPHYDTCPLEPADYWFKEYTFDAAEYQAFMKDGQYKMEMYLIKGDEPIAGGVSRMRVEPASGNE
ncbi:uncharacterized protein LOC134208021 [Armigeres subalbatus]|uniref:uncharacterized protein LOC134208021 n=1 Tax=Armigeres subalbatus TaxID=124917 RepID=UPI002ED3E496